MKKSSPRPADSDPIQVQGEPPSIPRYLIKKIEICLSISTEQIPQCETSKSLWKYRRFRRFSSGSSWFAKTSSIIARSSLGNSFSMLLLIVSKKPSSSGMSKMQYCAIVSKMDATLSSGVSEEERNIRHKQVEIDFPNSPTRDGSSIVIEGKWV